MITRDGRQSGPELVDALRRTITAGGRDCLHANVAATPTTGVLVRRHKAAGGLQISASHNPAEYNGLKLFSAHGRVLTAAAGQKVLDVYRDATFRPLTVARPGDSVEIRDNTSRHVKLVLKRVDVERIRAHRFRVLLDANHGAGSVAARPLLEQLGCDVTEVGGEPDGRFSHTPEPTAENLASVLPLVRKHGAQIGFCVDPDADRLAVIDAQGVYLGEEYTLAMCVDHRLRTAPGPIVTNCSTSRMSEDLAEKYAVPFYRSAVGEAHVVDQILDRGAVLGGEGNGGVIDPRVGCVRDSLVGMALLLDAMAARQTSVSALAAELPRYEICKTKISLPSEKVTAGLSALARHFKDATADRLDGLRLDWPGRWLLVRASNTEPIVRAIAEAGTAAEAERLCHDAAAVLSSV